MTTFQLYFHEGLRHITDLQAYDHILFVLSIAVPYQWRDWKQLLGLVTAFTLGHSLTLALATLKIILLPTAIIELLIPVTIMCSSVLNWVWTSNERPARLRTKYIITAVFGLIHGLGFSNFLRSMLGKEESIIQPLLAFNIGLEMGQLAIVAVALIVGIGVIAALKRPYREWIIFASGGTTIAALLIFIELLLATE
jgi:uncharacterized protein YacL